MRPTTPLLTCAALLCLATASFGQTTAAVTDQATFTSGLASFLLEDFQDEVDGPLDQTILAPFNGFSSLPNGTSTFTSDYEVDTEFAGSTNLELDLFLDNTGGFIDAVTFTFDSPVTAFGLLIDDIDATGETNLAVGGDAFNLQALLPGTDDEAFFSFTNPAGIASFTLQVDAGAFDGLSIDNVVSGQLVPEPSTLVLVGLASTLCVPLVRRRR